MCEKIDVKHKDEENENKKKPKNTCKRYGKHGKHILTIENRNYIHAIQRHTLCTYR